MTTVENLRLDHIRPSALNPRKVYDEAGLQELADSIKNQGLLNPIAVRGTCFDMEGDGEPLYEIIYGERRWRAMQMNNAETIPAMIYNVTDDEAFDMMITENLQRQNIAPLDEATAYKALQERGLSVTDMAAKFGKSERYIRDRLKLNDLIPIFKEALSHDKLTLGGAVMLARLDEAAQAEFADDHGYEDDEDWDAAEALNSQDIRDDIEDNFVTLDRALFLPEDEWNKDQQPRLCSMCANNTSCQQSIWPELAARARCTDETCFKDKLDRYISYVIESARDRILPATTDKFDLAMAPKDSLILYCERPQAYWRDDELKRTQAVIDRYKKRFLILFNDQIQVEFNDQNADMIDRALEAGDIIEGINIYNMAAGRPQYHKYYRIRYAEAEEEGRQKNRLLAQYDRLKAEESMFAIDLMNKSLVEQFKTFDLFSDDPILKVFVASCARENYYDSVGVFKTDDGTRKTLDTLDAIEEWWQTFQDKQQTPFGFALERLVVNLKNHKLLESLMSRFLPKEMERCHSEAQAEYEGKKKAIEDELHELGYDTKGNPLPENESKEQPAG